MTQSNNDAVERAVSPVLGVIMMVALTILLASVMGVFVIGVGETAQDRPPTVQFDAEWTGDTLTVAHVAGEAVPRKRLAVVGPDGFDVTFDDEAAWDTPWNQPVSAGQSRQVNGVEDVEPGTYRIVWRGTGTSAVIQTVDRVD